MPKKIDDRGYFPAGLSLFSLAVYFITLFGSRPFKELYDPLYDPLTAFLISAISSISIFVSLYYLAQASLIHFYNNSLLPSLQQGCGCKCRKDDEDPTIP